MSARPPSLWSGQRAFRTLAQADARELFRALDARLQPKVILVGLLWEDVTDRPPVWLEPTGQDALAERLVDVRTAASAPSTAETPVGVIAHQRLTMDHAQRSRHVAAQRALQRAIDLDDVDGGLVSFCSLPQRIGAYMVSTVVRFDRTAYAAHGAEGQRPDPETGLFASLLDATIDEYLGECAFALSQPELGRFGVTGREVPELLRAAGKKLMHHPGAAMHGMLDLFDICNMISTMRYEGGESVGGLLVAPSGAPGVEVALALREPVGLRDYRTIRKLLEVTGGGMQLLCSDGAVYGLGPASGVAEAFRIGFTGHHAWRLELGGRVLMEVGYGQPQLPKERISRTGFRRQVERAFPSIGAPEIATLWALVSEATRQRHGTMVVVSSGAESEAARLRRQGTPIEPTALTTQLMALVTAIDGAVLMDPHNVCHAIGVILDGLATDAGDPSRGARFNSAIRYVESTEHACLAIVVSEDGMIDVVTKP